MAKEPAKIVISKARDSKWEKKGLRTFFEYRNLGFTDATEGRFSGSVARAVGPRDPDHEAPMHYHKDAVFTFAYVLKGSMRNYFEGVGEVVLQEGDTIAYEGELIQAHSEYSADFQILQINMPADCVAVNVPKPTDKN